GRTGAPGGPGGRAAARAGRARPARGACCPGRRGSAGREPAGPPGGAHRDRLRRRLHRGPHPQAADGLRHMTEQETSELGRAIQEVSEKASLLVREEIALAKAELTQKATSLAR